MKASREQRSIIENQMILDEDDSYDCHCAEIFLTRKSYLVCRCSLCDDIFSSFTDIALHLETHFLDRNIKVKQLENGPHTEDRMKHETGTDMNVNPDYEYLESETSPEMVMETMHLDVETLDDMNINYKDIIIETIEDDEVEETETSLAEGTEEHSNDGSELIEFNGDAFDGEMQGFIENSGVIEEDCEKLVVVQVSDVELKECQLGLRENPAEPIKTELAGMEELPKEQEKLKKRKQANLKIQQFVPLKKPKMSTGSEDMNEDEEEKVFSTNLYRCSDCDQTFASKRKLNIHLQAHSQQRDFKCHICGFTFKQRYNLNAHLRRHDKDPKHTCDVCLKKFHTNSELKRHFRFHTGERQFVCSYCGLSFYTSGALDDHTNRHTNNRPCKCSHCGKAFFSKYQLNAHLVLHSAERNFVCTECGKRFPRRKALKAHIKIHENLREYVCDLCGMDFNQRPALTTHLKRRHDNKLTTTTATTTAEATMATTTTAKQQQQQQ